MRFVWDEAKDQINRQKHGFSFADAEKVFAFPMLVGLDDRFDYGEDRWIGIGMLEGRIVVVVYTESDDGTVRIISLRKALSHERRDYEEELRNRLEASGLADR